MIIGDWFVVFLIVQYALAALAYAVSGLYPKALYFVGAVLLSLGVLWMR